jgi:hypothetical protein
MNGTTSGNDLGSSTKCAPERSTNHGRPEMDALVACRRLNQNNPVECLCEGLRLFADLKIDAQH